MVKKHTRLTALALALVLLLSLAPIVGAADEQTPDPQNTPQTAAEPATPTPSDPVTPAASDPATPAPSDPVTPTPSNPVTPTPAADPAPADPVEGDSGINPVGTDTEENFYNTTTSDIGSATEKTHNVFIAVDRGMLITSFNGTSFDSSLFNNAGLNTSLVTLESTTTGTGTACLKVRGLKEGVTSFQFNNEKYTLYVVRNHPSYRANSKTVKISVKDLKNCKTYFSINASDLQEITGKGYLINQTFIGGFQISFFSAPNKGYSLTKMNITRTQNQYYSMGEGTASDCSDTEAWPLVNQEATSIADENGWKFDLDQNGNPTSNKHGFSVPLSHNNGNFMSLARLRELYAKAKTLGCDGTAQFGNYVDQDSRNAEITFEAEELPKLTKSITGYKLSTDPETADWNTYTSSAAPQLHLGDKLQYTFTIERAGTQDVVYTDVMLTDEQIGYKLLLTYDIDTKKMVGYVGGVKKETPDKEWDVSTNVMEITTEYTIKEQDIKKYSSGEFKNTATLSYTYKSRYSAGQYNVSQQSHVTCTISGLAIYSWDSTVPEAIQKEYPCPETHVFTVNSEATIRGFSKEVEPVVLNNNGTWQKWTFKGWNLTEENNPQQFYKPGNKVNVSNYNAPNSHLVGYWEAADLTSNTVTYSWSGLPEGQNAAVLPSTTTKYETETFPIDGNYTAGYEVTIGNEIYVFSGWKLNDQVVSGEYTMGESAITFTGVWTKQSALVDLIIKVENCNTDLDENQTFLFQVTGGGLTRTVTVHRNGRTTITGLRAGEYTVTELTNWSWRYTPVNNTDNTTQATQTITLAESGLNQVTFHHERSNTQWLDGNHFWNIFKSKEGA